MTNPTPADHATKPSERIRADAAFPDNPVSLLLAVLRYLDAQAMDNAGKSPGDDPLITSPGSACQCGHRCDSHHAVNGHCLSCPCKGFRYYTATATGSCHCERDGLLPDEEHAAGCPSGEHSKGLAVPDSEFADPAVDVCYCGSKESEHTEAMGHGFFRAVADPGEPVAPPVPVEDMTCRNWMRAEITSLRARLAKSDHQLTLCAKEVNELVSSNDEAQLLYVQMEKAWESASKQREELRAELSQLKTELALSTESDLRITRKYNALEAELGGFRYDMEAVLFGSRDEHSLDEMIERASSLSVVSANPAASPSGEVAAPSPVAPTCVRCDGPVESKRWVYALPTCYACLPPPPPIPLLTDADFPKRAEQVPQTDTQCASEWSPGNRCVGRVNHEGQHWTSKRRIVWSSDAAPQAEATPPEPPCGGLTGAEWQRREEGIIRAAEGVTLEPDDECNTESDTCEICGRKREQGGAVFIAELRSTLTATEAKLEAEIARWRGRTRQLELGCEQAWQALMPAKRDEREAALATLRGLLGHAPTETPAGVTK